MPRFLVNLLRRPQDRSLTMGQDANHTCTQGIDLRRPFCPSLKTKKGQSKKQACPKPTNRAPPYHSNNQHGQRSPTGQ